MVAGLFSSPQPSQALSNNIVISQVYGGGGNSGAPYMNDFVELFNRGTTTVSISGWSVQYASATGTGNFSGNPVTLLNGTLNPGQYYLVQLASGGANGTSLPTPDALGLANMSGVSGKVILSYSSTGLACNGGSTVCDADQLAAIVDLVGYGGANFFETNPAPGITNSTAVFRGDGGCTDTDNNLNDFSAATPNPRNTASPSNLCATPSNPSGIGAADPDPVTVGGSTLLTGTVTPGSNPTSTGLAVVGDLSEIGGSATQPFFDDGSNGDVTAGDNIFSFLASVPGATSMGTKNLPITISDAQGRSGSSTISLTVLFDFSGFFSPVENLPAVNTAKAGSSVSIKFSLGGDQGLAIMAANFPRSIRIDCDPPDQVNDSDERVAATAGRSVLTYDPVTNQYGYVWKTEKAWGDTCRQFILKLADGTTHVANFKFN
jgi:hypothetical protein